jgi:hypothetical protein
MAKREAFGSIRLLPSGKWQARYIGPDLIRHTGRFTFSTKQDARGWLAQRKAEIVSGVWKSSRLPLQRAGTFADYAEAWLAERDLRPRTTELYRSL